MVGIERAQNMTKAGINEHVLWGVQEQGTAVKVRVVVGSNEAAYLLLPPAAAREIAAAMIEAADEAERLAAR
jgi:hypothetical protein